MSRVLHLARRFVLSLWPGGPDRTDDLWARSRLLAGEVALWGRMSGPDRRHAVMVARRVEGSLGVDVERRVLAAALLHDVGKVDSSLSTPVRVVATLAGLAGGARVHAGHGRIARYLHHPEIGSRLLVEAGSDPLTSAWAAEHHLPPDQWTVDRQIGEALRAADDD